MKSLVITKSIHHDQILIVKLNSPESRNAICRKTALTLLEIFQKFDASPSHRVAILTGSDTIFCSGANLKFVGNDHANNTPESFKSDCNQNSTINQNDIQGRNDINEDPNAPGPLGVTRLFLKKPVIAAIEGYCVAGGLELACWCDLRVGSRNSIYGVFCRRFSVPLIDLGTIRLPRLIGYSRAMDMILTGRAVHAQEAYSFGLINRLVDPGKALEEAINLAMLIASHPQICMRNDRISMYQSVFDGFKMDDAIQNEVRLGKESLNSDEFQVALERFLKGEGRHGAFNLSKI